MRRIVKDVGVGNFRLEEAPVPTPGPRQVLIRNHRTLISRGSEIGGRYRQHDPVDPAAIGYSAAGEIVATGRDVTEHVPGQRVAVLAPHAEYVIGDLDAIAAMAVTPMPDDVSFEQAVFHPLSIGAVLWTQIAGIQPEETVVVTGQGLVGNLVLQAAQSHQPAMVIAVDAMESRCATAARFGADVVINVREEDPVARVRELTSGEGAHVVMECVGGPAGVHSFPQAVEMTRRMGRIHLISLFHEQPLPLDSRAVQQRKIIGGYYTDLETTWRPAADEAMRKIAAGDFEVDSLVTHRFAPSDASAAFALLHDRPAEAFGVLFDWEE